MPQIPFQKEELLLKSLPNVGGRALKSQKSSVGKLYIHPALRFVRFDPEEVRTALSISVSVFGRGKSTMNSPSPNIGEPFS